MKRLFLLCFPFFIYAATFTGNGYAKEREVAKNEALADLSSSLKSEVKTHFESWGETGKATLTKRKLEITGELPLLGCEVQIRSIEGGFEATVTLNEKSLPLYEAIMLQNINEINKAYSQAQQGKSSDKELAILAGLKYFEDYEKHMNVAMLLGSQLTQKPACTKIAMIGILKNVTETIDTLDKGIKKLVQGIEGQGIYIFPPKAEGSSFPTQLSQIIKDKLTTQLDGVAHYREAKVIVTGHYSIVGDGIDVTMIFSEVNKGGTLAVRTVHLLPEAYHMYDFTPKSTSFEKLLKEGLITGNEFRVAFQTDKGSEDLLFRKNDEVDLLIKVNQKGFYYIVGHTKKGNETFSYLVELNPNVEGKWRFIHRVSPEEINQWVSLGKFSIEPPFGQETLHVIASTTEFSKIPESVWDKEKGYYIISRDILQGVIATRAIKPQVTAQTKVSEAILGFVTVEK